MSWLSACFYDSKKSNQSQGFHHEMAQEQNWLSLATMRSYICILCLFVHLFVVDGVWTCELLLFFCHVRRQKAWLTEQQPEAHISFYEDGSCVRTAFLSQ